MFLQFYNDPALQLASMNGMDRTCYIYYVNKVMTWITTKSKEMKSKHLNLYILMS